MTIIINSKNIAQNPWMWDYLEFQRQKNNQNILLKGTTFKHNNQEYQLGETIIARERKENRGYAYEMVSEICLRLEGWGYVMKIACTISQGKNNKFQALNKNRVVKYTTLAEEEYAMGQDAKHMKKPVGHRVVMRNLSDQTLAKFREGNYTNYRQITLDLTKELLAVYKKQLVDRNLRHDNFSESNVLVKYDPENTSQPFQMDIVDFGSVHPDQRIKRQANHSDLIRTLRYIWDIPRKPSSVTSFLENSHEFEEYIDFFEKLVLSPCDHSQRSFDNLLAFFDELGKSNLVLSEQLKNKVLEATKASSAENMQPLRDAIIDCRKLLMEKKIEAPSFPVVIFDENKNRQRLFYQIKQKYDELEQKGLSLCRDPSLSEEGKKLCEVVKQLRTKTLNAIYAPDAQKKTELSECRDLCKELLKENKGLLDIHRDNRYLLAEVGVVLSSLIIFYPVVLGANYLYTGKLGFFGETNSAQAAKYIDEDFAALEATFTS